MRLLVVVAIGVCCLGGGALAQPGSDAHVPPSQPKAEYQAPLAPPTPAEASYYDVVLDAVHAHLQYPPQAINSREEGTCRVRVEFEREGTINGMSLIKSSGSQSPDAECSDVFARVGKLPPVPASVRAAKDMVFKFELPITFDLSSQ